MVKVPAFPGVRKEERKEAKKVSHGPPGAKTVFPITLPSELRYQPNCTEPLVLPSAVQPYPLEQYRVF